MYQNLPPPSHPPPPRTIPPPPPLHQQQQHNNIVNNNQRHVAPTLMGFTPGMTANQSPGSMNNDHKNNYQGAGTQNNNMLNSEFSNHKINSNGGNKDNWTPSKIKKSLNPFESEITVSYTLSRGFKQETVYKFIEWNCSGKFLAIGSDKSQCKIVDVERDAVCCAPISMAPTGQGAHNFSRDPSTVSGEPLIPQTKSMYSPSSSLNGQNAGSVIKWHPTNPSLLTTVSKNHNQGEDQIHFWDLRESSKARPLRSVNTTAGTIHSNISPDGNFMILNTYNNDFCTFDLRMYERICSNSTDKVFETNEIVFSADSKLLYIAGQRLDKIKKEWGQVEVMDVDSLELLSERNRDSDDWMTSYTFIGHTQNATRVAIDHVHGRLASGGMDALTSVFDIDSGACLYALDTFTHVVRSVSFSHCGQFVAAGDGHGPMKERENLNNGNFNKYSLVIADAAEGDILYELKHCLGIQSLRWSPKANVLAYLYDNLSPAVTGVGNMMQTQFSERDRYGSNPVIQGEVRIIGLSSYAT